MVSNWKNNFRVNITLRVLALLLTMFALIKLSNSGGSNMIWTTSFVAAVLFYQVYTLIRLMEDTNRELLNFLSSIRYDDFTQTYRLSGKGGTFDELNREFNKVIHKFKEIRAEKEAEYQYLKNIIHHIGIGILSFDKEGNVQIINTAAKRLFKVSRLRNIQNLADFSPELVENLEQLRTGSKSLVRIRKNGEMIQLAIYGIELYLKGEEFKLVTIQNIHSELEEQEMDAWQNLIRVLTHEIMNSVAPISSLAQTVEGEVSYLKQEDELIKPEDLEDIQMAIQTIQRRSENLIKFINEFRSLTHVQTPKMEHVEVARMFEEVKLLMNHDCNDTKIMLHLKVEPINLMLTADPALIEQVLINIVKNAIQALQAMTDEENPQKEVWLTAELDKNSRPVITIRDNGTGIEKDALDRIFIPFFSTKKGGSGIGLSLSRQIMRQHKGTITATSTLGEGTMFQLKF